jgi:outer membrane protein assembly factor BamB
MFDLLRAMRKGSTGVAIVGLVACGSDSNTSGSELIDQGDVAAPPGADATTEVFGSDAIHPVDTGDDIGRDVSSLDAIAPDPESSVLLHHHHASRDGLYTQPLLTKAAASAMRRELDFDGSVEGNVYAQPLYVVDGPAGKGTFYVATESDWVYALDEMSGKTVWRKDFGPTAAVTGAGCGNITPLGITGTPVIDRARRTMYLDAVVGTGGTLNSIKTHLIHAISIDDGSEVSGWPLDTSNIKFGATPFKSVYENQRAALIIAGSILYVAFSGHGGDCGDFRGWVVGVPLDQPQLPSSWAGAVDKNGAGIWEPGGPASDGTDLFVTTGNTFGLPAWDGGEAVIRFQPGAVFSGNDADYFRPSNWSYLNDHDMDLSGSGPLLVDAPGLTPSKVVVAFGKNGLVYVLGRTNLGGVGKGNGLYQEGIASAPVAESHIINSAAAYTSPAGTFVIFHVYDGRSGLLCPGGQSGDLVGLKIGGEAPIEVAWCRDNGGEGSPMITTTDGQNEGIVWTAGGESPSHPGSQRLHAWDAETGQLIYSGGGPDDLMVGVRRFATPIAAHGRILVGADDRLYAFSLPNLQ